MDLERKRVAANNNSSRNGVVVGSVWETRMSGSFKVFNGDDKNMDPTQENETTEKVVFKSKQTLNGGGKRKTWKSDEGIPAQIPKVRSENKKMVGELDGNGIKKSPIQVKKEWNKEQSPVKRTIKTRSLSRKGSTSDGIEKLMPLPTQGTPPPISDNGVKEIEDANQMKNNGSDSSQSLEELGVPCEEKLMTDNLEDHEQPSTKKTVEENEERSIVVVSTINKNNSPDVVIEDKKIHPPSNPISRTIRKQPPPPTIISKSNEYPPRRAPKSHGKLQSLVDLIMWRDASKSALIFGFGTFSILSSSFTKDLNISFISVISYLGLVYLAAIFIFRTFLFRGVVEADNMTDDEECVLGEEEAIWALKLFLPYINEFLLKVKALFSGDPATTMKLAVLLFVLARCGSSITIWKMAKMAFFGVFTVPKICSSYSSQLTAYGTFWVGRFKDAWESCSQKKAVAIGVFTLVWNLSSIIARIWAVFMLLVAFKYYQQSISMMKDEVVEEEEPMVQRNQSSWREQRNANNIMPTQSKKLRKRT